MHAISLRNNRIISTLLTLFVSALFLLTNAIELQGRPWWTRRHVDTPHIPHNKVTPPPKRVLKTGAVVSPKHAWPISQERTRAFKATSMGRAGQLTLLVRDNGLTTFVLLPTQKHFARVFGEQMATPAHISEVNKCRRNYRAHGAYLPDSRVTAPEFLIQFKDSAKSGPVVIIGHASPDGGLVLPGGQVVPLEHIHNIARDCGTSHVVLTCNNSHLSAGLISMKEASHMWLEILNDLRTGRAHTVADVSEALDDIRADTSSFGVTISYSAVVNDNPDNAMFVVFIIEPTSPFLFRIMIPANWILGLAFLATALEYRSHGSPLKLLYTRRKQLISNPVRESAVSKLSLLRHLRAVAMVLLFLAAVTGIFVFRYETFVHSRGGVARWWLVTLAGLSLLPIALGIGLWRYDPFQTILTRIFSMLGTLLLFPFYLLGVTLALMITFLASPARTMPRWINVILTVCLCILIAFLLTISEHWWEVPLVAASLVGLVCVLPRIHRYFYEMLAAAWNGHSIWTVVVREALPK